MYQFAMYEGFSERILENGVADTARYAKKMGFSAVEFLANMFSKENTPFHDMESAKEAGKVLESYHLPTACYSVYCDLWSDPKIESLMLKQVEIAAALKSPYFHHTLLPWLVLPENAPEYERAVAEVVERAGKIADYAKDFGITCIYEDQGLYVNGIDGFRLFWKQMKERSDNVGICGDLG